MRTARKMRHRSQSSRLDIGRPSGRSSMLEGATYTRLPVPIFESDLKSAIKRLGEKQFSNVEERDALLTQIRTADGVRARDVVWMLFRPDRAIRETGVRALQR